MTDPAALSGYWIFPTKVRFGVGQIGRLPREAKRLGMTRPLLVTDPGLAGLPMVRDALAALEADGLAAGLFSEVKGNPTGTNLSAGVAAFRAGNHDGVIALGGGSAMDCGKAIAFVSAQDGQWQDYAVGGPGFGRAETASVAPIIAVPTTAGTGSEVGRAAVITDEASETKLILIDMAMMPSLVISDPVLSVGLPANLTAWTGLDALAHCLEAYSTTAFHPMADGIAVEGVRLIKTWLPRAVADGTDLEARACMLAAASMGATAFNKGLGAVHALSHPFGALFDTHHGLTNAVFLPYVLAFNRAAIEAKMERLGAYLGLADPRFEGVMDWMLSLRAELGIPHLLGDLKDPGDLAESIAERAARDPCAAENPIPFAAGEARKVMDSALSGAL